jgi:hypothetical protein
LRRPHKEAEGCRETGTGPTPRVSYLEMDGLDWTGLAPRDVTLYHFAGHLTSSGAAPFVMLRDLHDRRERPQPYMMALGADEGLRLMSKGG